MFEHPIVIISYAIIIATLCVHLSFRILGIILYYYLRDIFHSAERLYFHGFNLYCHISRKSFSRLGAWLQPHSLCYEAGILSMMILRHNPTATLCRGFCEDPQNDFYSRHSWVEFKLGILGWFIMDLSWLSVGICSKKAYFNESANIITMWKYPYQDFWKIPLVNTLYKAMQKPQTSHIFYELSAFDDNGGTYTESYDFAGNINTDQLELSHNGTFMFPYRRSHAHNQPVSTEIIQDFIKNPRRRHPRSRSLRRARYAIRTYNHWYIQQANEKLEHSQNKY